MSGGITSGRVERSWPNLTNVGPSSSSISRSRRPRSASCVSSLLRRRSIRYPKPWRVATRPISESRPILRWGRVGRPTSCGQLAERPRPAARPAASRAGAPDARAARREARDRPPLRAGRARGAAEPSPTSSEGCAPSCLRFGAPARDRVAHRGPHLVTLDTDPTREIVGDVIRRLGGRATSSRARRAAAARAGEAPCRSPFLSSMAEVYAERVGVRGDGSAGAAVRAARAARAAPVAAGRARRRRRGHGAEPAPGLGGAASSSASAASVGRLEATSVPPTDCTSTASSCLRRANSGSRSLIQSSSGAATKIDE